MKEPTEMEFQRHLGIADGMLYSRRKTDKQTGIPFENQKPQSAEVASLRREITTRLSEECAFLKKTAAYFAKEPKYDMIKANEQFFQVQMMCRVLCLLLLYIFWLLCTIAKILGTKFLRIFQLI